MKDFLRKPWVAAILNFSFPGLGYLAIGKRKNFAYFVLASTILYAIGFFLYGQLDNPDMMQPYDWLVGAAGVALSTGFAYDAYHEAKK